MKNVVSNLLNDKNYRKVLHLVLSDVEKLHKIKEIIKEEEDKIREILNDLHNKNIIDFKDENNIKPKIEDLIILIDLKKGSIYKISSKKVCDEIRSLLNSEDNK